MKISVVTPSYNSVATIRQTIESVRHQDYQDWEHIVVDGGSTDGTVALLKSFPHLLWSSERDEGHYHAMNKGVQRAAGDVILILNADDWLLPGALTAVVDGFAQNPSWDALFGDAVFVDNEGNKIYQRDEATYDFRVLLYGLDYICHQALFVRKAVYSQLGSYRYKEFLNSADYEFKLRLGRGGCRVGHIPRLLVNYRYHERGQSADKRVIRNMLQETAIIRREYGNKGGFPGRVLSIVYKLKRQGQKLLIRHTCDLIPGTWLLKSHLREKTEFSSNAGVDKLPQ
ncbi:MAG TPA: glycosyltransferase family 2 protein [Candidatus Dormibacteraeota bacterium]|nr:glycosyltransferase family 2 protein [Candidatus Dormibacteraeota bacterium]